MDSTPPHLPLVLNRGWSLATRIGCNRWEHWASVIQLFGIRLYS